MTQGGNLGQMISFVLLLIGFSKDPGEAEAAANGLLIALSVGAYILSFIVSWLGRIRAGGVNVWGGKM